ncbi:MAG: glycine betaine ABC transporter substrate-binding protein, partial [Thermoanaerobaculia bacterium]
AFAGLLLLSGCGGGSGDRPIRVGSKNFSEQVLLGEIAAQALEASGLRVDRRLNLGGTFICHNAVRAGELDLYPEYTGTAFTAILGRKPVSDPAAVRRAVESAYAGQWDLVWSPPLGFENNFALIVRRQDAARWNLRRISDLAGREGQIRPGFGYEFVERQDGFPGLARAYGLKFPLRPVEMDLGLLYPALESGKVDLIAGNSTDGLIAALGAVVLEDDRRYFPPYEAAFVVRGKRWRGNRAVREALQGLGSSLDASTMRRLNAAVDRDKRRPEQVAREFLAGKASGGR